MGSMWRSTDRNASNHEATKLRAGHISESAGELYVVIRREGKGAEGKGKGV